MEDNVKEINSRITRRNLMKDTLTWFSLIFSIGLSNNVLAINETECRSMNSPPHPFKPWARTIFCTVDDDAIMKTVESHASELGCRVVKGEPFSPDIIVHGYFIAIVDRRLIGKEMWQSYMDYRNEADDHVPCIVVDDFEWQLDGFNLFHVRKAGSETSPELSQKIRRAFQVVTINRAYIDRL